MLGPARLPHMLNSSAHLEKLISALVHLMELDTAGAKIIEEDFIVKGSNYQAHPKVVYQMFYFAMSSHILLRTLLCI